jgi:hypothetical protein
LRNATTGKIVPANASTHKKKNNHRVPPLGVVLLSKKYNPPQPSIIKIMAAGRNDETAGGAFDDMFPRSQSPVLL